MANKLFISKRITPDTEKEVFRYDYLPSIKRQMICDGYGFYHSTGKKISLNTNILKSNHLIQAWDLGNGNIISKERKVIECSEYYSINTNQLCVAYTYSVACKNYCEEEIYGIYLYCIKLEGTVKSLYYNPRLNIFDYFKAERIFSTGINVHLSFEEEDQGIILKWINMIDRKANCKKEYSLNINTDVISYVEKLDNKYKREIETLSEKTSEKVKYYQHPDNTDLHIVVVSPDKEDKTKRKSPAIVICLGGPNIDIPNFEKKDLIYKQFSKKGFYVIIPLRRGICGITQQWEDELIGNYGIKDIEDIISSTEYILSILSDKIDSYKLGLYGASYGGYSALLIAAKCNLFYAIVSHCGVSDLISYPKECYGNEYDIMKTYTGTDNHNKYKRYAYAISPYQHIHQWTAPVLLVHTIDDSSVFFGQSVRAYNKCIRLKKDAQLLLAPGPHSYNIRNGNKLIDYIIDFYSSKFIQ